MGAGVDGQERHAYPTQNEAIIRGRGLADNNGGELVIHGVDGQIRDKVPHVNDPRDIPG